MNPKYQCPPECPYQADDNLIQRSKLLLTASLIKGRIFIIVFVGVILMAISTVQLEKRRPSNSEFLQWTLMLVLSLLDEKAMLKAAQKYLKLEDLKDGNQNDHD